MSIKIHIQPKIIYYSENEYTEWINGKRENCSDKYLKNLKGSYGFGEIIVGRHFEKLGYKYIHHDFNIFGGNKLGKYPFAEEVIYHCIGIEKYNNIRTLYKVYRNIEEPDLMIYKPDFSELRFAESKRSDTRDKLREKQVRGLALLSLLLGCNVDVFEVVKEDKQHEPSLITFEF